MADFLKGLIKRLTNLSSGNRMLFMPRLSPGRQEDLCDFSFLNGQSTFQNLSHFLKGNSVKLCPVHDSRMNEANKASVRLRKLYRSVNSIFEETGSKDLYVAYLFVHGKLSNGTPLRSPLVLIPAELNIESGNWVLTLSAEARPVLNKSFLYAFAHHQNIPLAENLIEEDFDEVNSILDLKNTLISSFKEADIDLNFRSDFFQEVVVPFLTLKKSEFLNDHAEGVLKVLPEIVLGVFPQSDSYLESDYRNLIAVGRYGNADDFFQSLTVREPLAEPAEGRMINAFPMDPWQERVIRNVKRGYSVVVEGPPGTGKSQLICNLLSDAIASKKRVLVVSQKRAALDVVWDRMAATGLQPFMARVHDFKDDRRQVFAGIADQIEKLEEYRQLNRSIDSIQTERQFQTTSNRIDQLVEQLSEFQSALSDEQICGMSIKEMYLHADTSAPGIPLRNELHLLRLDQSDDLERKIYSYSSHRKILAVGAPSWFHRISFSKWNQSDLQRMAQLIESLQHEIHSLAIPVEDFVGSKLDLDQFRALEEDQDKLGNITDLFVPNEFGFLQRLTDHPSDDVNDLWLANLQRLVEGCFQGAGVECSLTHENIEVAQQALHRNIVAQKNIFRWLWWSLFSKDKFLIRRLMVANHLKGSTGLQLLEQKLDNRLNLEHLISKLQEKDWTFRIPKTYSIDEFRQWFEATRRALRIRDSIQSSRVLPNLLSSCIATGDPERFVNFVDLLKVQTKKFSTLHSNYLSYFLPRQLDELYSQPDLSYQWSVELKEYFDRMHAADLIFDSMDQWEKDLLGRLEEVVPDYDPDKTVWVLHNSMLTAWINYLEARTPVLRMTNSGEMHLMESELQKLDVVKRKLGVSMALLRARERMIEEVSINRLNNVVTYRELLHQVTKKRKIWPLRKLIAEFHDELFRVVPCWLASPDAVSAVFPLERYFDLVVFDEASQCYPEWGIPAIARASQVVVAGDPQQLRPFDFYRIRWQEEEVESALESESLLEMMRLQLPVNRLQAHYRSQHPDLIAFSNRHFYQDRLLTLPDRNYFNSGVCAFEFVKVEGVWEDQINFIEAQKIVQVIWKYYTESPQVSLGVITFNHPQQQLILDLVESYFMDRGFQVPDNLFIKNIENVQGDERDVIIFSVGYAPAKNNRVMLQFGSLNTEGGVNRLNVAVTRSRYKMIVVTSIEPHQLETEGASSAGPHLLRSWLEFVKERSIAPSSEWQSPPRGKESGWYLSDRLLQAEALSGRIQAPPFAFADLVTIKEGKLNRILLTDDERYLNAPSPKLYHSFLPALFAEKNWEWEFIHSRSYWLNSEKVITEVLVPGHEVPQPDVTESDGLEFGNPDSLN